MAEQADRLQQRATYTTQAMLPALLIAQRVYQDGSRADELVTRNQVRNPLSCRRASWRCCADGSGQRQPDHTGGRRPGLWWLEEPGSGTRH
ncbi:hypothetical protein WJ968_04840 [Achromobacter xylosoxidans]